MTEDIAIYRPTPIELTRTTTDDWFDAFTNIVKLAEYVSDTEFVPDAMRRKPAAVAAAILTGREMGLPPMVALRHLYVIKGRVGQSAELMRAQVYRAGHEIRYIESTDQRCVVEGRRKDETDWTRVQFTTEDARNAGIDLRGYAADKLLARATSRLARRKFPDSVMGLPTADEIEDYDTAAVVELASVTDSPAVQRKRQPRKPKAAATQPKTAPKPTPTTDDDDLLNDDIEDIDIADLNAINQLAQTQATLQAAELLTAQTGDGDDVADLFTPPEPQPPATKKQLDRIHAAFTDMHVTESQDRHTIIEHITGTPCTNTNQLDRNEATRVIDRFVEWYRNDEYLVGDRVRDILNEATIAEAETDEPQE